MGLTGGAAGASIVLRDALVAGERVDVLVRDGVIAAIGEVADASVEEVRLDGRALVPGRGTTTCT